MKHSASALYFLLAFTTSQVVLADHHIDDLMSDGVDYDSATVETVTTESINMPLVNKPISNIKRPSRSDSQNKVMSDFGTPMKKHPARGKPPIEKWDYPEFTVIFESGYVIHSVVRSNKM